MERLKLWPRCLLEIGFGQLSGLFIPWDNMIISDKFRMMPEEEKYGPWPRSGEIDIAEARGNNIEYPLGGRDTFTSTLHWGPSTNQDAFWRTTAGRAIRRADFAQSYHTFGLEWSGDYMYTYMDSRLQQILYVGFVGKGTPPSLWDRGGFSSEAGPNNTLLVDPWSATGNHNTPFDQSFYLILNVAVGSGNGWFL
jgi:hypothetical protein